MISQFLNWIQTWEGFFATCVAIMFLVIYLAIKGAYERIDKINKKLDAQDAIGETENKQ